MSIFSGFFKSVASAAISTATVASGATGMPDAGQYAKNQRRLVEQSHRMAEKNMRQLTRGNNRRTSRRR